MAQELELYVHIPFCIKKCAYCDFLSGPATMERQKQYVDSLCREIKNCGDFSAYEVSSVFIGGGTPSAIPGVWMNTILQCIKEKFVLRQDAEISIEANPGNVDAEKLSFYRNAGINRISFGCQSADDRELKKLGRIHTWEEFLESFHLAREAGFTNINVDLMSGLPGQTEASWERGLTMVAELNPEHISAYSLIVEEGTPFADMVLDLPDEDTERVMYEKTNEILETYGYHQYEISNYAKENKECEHNKGYWTGKDYLGLGLGSASLISNKRFHNTEDMELYLKESYDPEKIREDEECLSKQEQIEETMILGLRMNQGISKEEFQKKYDVSMDEIYGDVIKKYKGMGYLHETEDRIRFTRSGVSVSNPILAEFIKDKS